MKDSPKVSVVMPVYNGERYLQESIESILNQTFNDFEFLIVNDCSTDQSEEIIRRYANKDNRIHLIINPKNLGIAEATNIGIANAHGEYIALMDQDDISLPERFEKEISFLETHPDVAVLGSNIRVLKEDGQLHDRHAVLETPGLVRWGLLFGNQIQNPTVMIQKNIFSKHGFAYENYMPTQDYQLWLRLSAKFNMANLPDSLLIHRLHNASASVNMRNLLSPNLLQMRKVFIKENLDLEVTDGISMGLLDMSCIHSIKDARIICKMIVKWYRLNQKNLNYEELNYIKQKTIRKLRNIWHLQNNSIRLSDFVLYSIFLSRKLC